MYEVFLVLANRTVPLQLVITFCDGLYCHTVYRVSDCCLSVYETLLGYDRVLEKRLGVLESPERVLEFYVSKRV